MAKAHVPFRARQPGKGLWTLVAIGHVALRMLYLSIYYAAPSARQNPEWTYRQAMTNELFRTSFYHMTLTRFLMPLTLKPGAEKERFVTLQPKEGIYNGILNNPSVQPVEIGATWYPKLFEPSDANKRVILHFHGGSFLWGEGRTSDCGPAADVFLKHIPGMALFVQYRLAHDNATTFPAPVQDALTAYQHLLDLNIPSSNIILSGDSAGGNIAIALLRYLTSPESNNMPRPGAMMLWSPSVDLATQNNPDSIDQHRNRKTDYITGFTLGWGIGQYVPKSMQVTDPYFSPILHPFATSTPIWIEVGGVEVLYDSTVDFAEKMSEAGNNVQLYTARNAPHDILFVGHLLGWQKETDAAAAAAARFLGVEETTQTGGLKTQ